MQEEIYINPLIAAIEDEEIRPDTICAHCPASIFYITSKDEIEAYCKPMNAIVYGKKQAPIVECSQQMIEILKLQSESDQEG